MKAPERIWIDNLDEGFWFDSPLGNKSIEYIRKDAFIEKAVSYIQQHWIWNTKIIKDFKNYMKGE